MTAKSPKEILKAAGQKVENKIPGFVYDAINNLLTKAFTVPYPPAYVNLTQSEIVNAIIERAATISRGTPWNYETIVGSHWMWFPRVYTERGWNITISNDADPIYTFTPT